MNTFGSNFFPASRSSTPWQRSFLQRRTSFPTAAPTSASGSSSQKERIHRRLQNRFMPSANAIWTVGRHTVTLSAGASPTRNSIPAIERTDKGVIALRRLLAIRSRDSKLPTARTASSPAPSCRATPTVTIVRENPFKHSGQISAPLQPECHRRTPLRLITAASPENTAEPLQLRAFALQLRRGHRHHRLQRADLRRQQFKLCSPQKV